MERVNGNLTTKPRIVVTRERLGVTHAGLLLGLLAGCAGNVEGGAVIDGASDADAEVGSISQALAGVPRSTGFVWSHDAKSASYVPAAGWSFNTSGGSNRVSRLGAGRYRVDMPGLYAPGNAQVVAYGTNNHRCQLFGAPYSAGGGVRFDTICTDPAGNLADSMFVAFFTNEGDYDGEVAMARVSSGGTLTASENAYVSSVSKISTGRYRLYLHSSMGTYRGVPSVTSIGSDGSFCMAGGVILGSSPYTEARCYSKTGEATDHAFSFLYLREPWFYYLTTASAATALYNEDHSTTGYYGVSGEREMVYFDFRTTGNVTATFYGTGMVGYPTSALVTAVGNGARYCKPASWTQGASDFTLNVACFDRAGYPADSWVSTNTFGKRSGGPGLVPF